MERGHGAQTVALDEKDETILRLLEQDGRTTLAQLAQAASLSVSATQSRVQKLERRGVIEGYKAIVNHERSGRPVLAFVEVTALDYSEEQRIPETLKGIDGIVSCDAVSGTPNFLLVVRAADARGLDDLLTTIHRAAPVSTETMVVLRRYFAR